MSKEKSGKTFVKRLVPLLLAAGMAFAILPMLTEQVYGETHFTLKWEYEYVFIHFEDSFSPYGEFEVEYDGNGDPFYRYGDEIFPVEQNSIRKEERTQDITIADGEFGYLKGDEFEDDDNRYFKYENIGWSTEPGGDIVLRNYQRIISAPGLQNGATLYPVWERTPNITYHHTITGQVMESRGACRVDVRVPFELPGNDDSPEYKEEVNGPASIAPYHIFSGWAESEDEAKNGVIKYNWDDEITHSDHIDLYTVWYQSRISDIPPAKVYNTNNAEHFWFGGRRWRKLGASDDKALLIYDDRMIMDYPDPTYDEAGNNYLHLLDCCTTGWFDSFSSAEKAAVCTTDKHDDISLANPPIDNAKLFLISWREAQTYFSGDEDRKLDGLWSDRWFLRVDPKKVHGLAEEDGILSLIKEDGSYGEVPSEVHFSHYEDIGIKWTAGERPAFVLDLSKVLFESVTKENTSLEPIDGSSFGSLENPYEHWISNQKLTLLDETYKDFAAHVNHSNRAFVNPGETVEVSYVNAMTDTEIEKNRHISAMLCDSHGDVIGYASMKPSASSGTWELKLPQNLDLSHEDYTLKVFNEQQNGGGDSNSASPFSIITLTKKDFTYAANGATITGTCADYCVSLTIAAPKRTTYGGAGSAEATLNGLADFNSATGKNVAEEDIRYVGRDGTAYAESASAPTVAGKYTAKITVEGKIASVDYEIAKADPSYTIEPKTVDAVITAADSDKTLIVPGEAEGGELLYAVSYGETPDASANLQKPGKDSESWSNAAPAGDAAGCYIIWYYIRGDANHHDSETSRLSKTIQPDDSGAAVFDKADSLPLGEVTVEQPCTSTGVKASVAGLMPEDAGTLIYTAGEAAVSGGATVSDFAVDHDGNVTAKISGGQGGDIITLPVTIGSTNYEDSSVAVIVTLTAANEDKPTTPAANEDKPTPPAVNEDKPTPPAAKTSIESAKVSGVKAKTWTGKALEQSPVVEVSGKTLKSDTDYTVVYQNNKNVGKATLTIKGAGSYTGTITKTFKINPKGTSLKKLKKGEKTITVKWKKQAKKMSKSRITGYQIRFATNKKFTKGKKTVTVKDYQTVSKKVTKLKAKKTYYVRVRTYKTVSGVKYYSPWSKAKIVKTK